MNVEARVKRGRGGRPAAGSEGDVEARLLAAATRLFLERGYDGTSCDQVAASAHAGKASIYARYANKEALFAAVVDHLLARSFALDDAVAGLPLDGRLAAVATRVLDDALHADTLALLRLLVAELPRLGDTAAFWQAGVRRIAAAIAPGTGVSAPAMDSASQFIDLVLAPPLMRALLGEPVAALVAEGPARITAAIATMHARRALDDWR